MFLWVPLRMNSFWFEQYVSFGKVVVSDMTKRFKVLASVLFLTLAGCNSVGTVQKIAPFPDRPEQYCMRSGDLRLKRLFLG